jgi:N utilization substance protein B
VQGARSRGRELALAVACHLESYAPDERAQAVPVVLDDPPHGDAEGEDAFAQLTAQPDARTFAEALVGDLLERWADVDALIEATSSRWRLERMDRVDRNVLRLAVIELGRADPPRGVVIAEAVRLAQRYGSERSVRFVNGLAESLAQRLRPAGDDDGPATAAKGESDA